MFGWFYIKQLKNLFLSYWRHNSKNTYDKIKYNYTTKQLLYSTLFYVDSWKG